MTYFNHSFKKTLVADTIYSDSGKLSAELAKDGAKKIGLFNQHYKNIAYGDWNTVATAKPFFIATSTPFTSDKLNQYLGGFQETNKTKLINPKYVSKVWVENATPTLQCEYVIGMDKDGASCATCTDGNGPFVTGQTYYLRVEAKGTPAMMFSTHNLYHDFEAYTGCAEYDENGIIVCAEESSVYAQWLRDISTNMILKDFVAPVIVIVDGDKKYYFTTADVKNHLNEGDFNITFDPTGTLTTEHWYELNFENADGYISFSDVVVDPLGTLVTAIEAISSPVYSLVLRGAYYDTRFGDCSWSKTDDFDVEPIRVFAQQVDVNGNVCEDQFVCGYESHPAVQGNGFGEQKLHEFLLSESYRQNFRADDARIREITKGDELESVLNRGSKYNSIFIEHSVPRYNNPTGVFDNDRYLIEIVVPSNDTTIIDKLSKMFDIILAANGAEPAIKPVNTSGYVEDYSTDISGNSDYAYVIE